MFFVELAGDARAKKDEVMDALGAAVARGEVKPSKKNEFVLMALTASNVHTAKLHAAVEGVVGTCPIKEDSSNFFKGSQIIKYTVSGDTVAVTGPLYMLHNYS
jgi:hypothetical protein